MSDNRLARIWRWWGQTVFGVEKVFSEKNGWITIQKFLGFRSVIVNGYLESGAYVSMVLRKILEKIPAKTRVKAVLMLGLGGGDGVRVLKARFPDATISVIEHDSIMVALARRIVFAPLGFTPEVLTEDARVGLEKLVNDGRKFDVIVVDLFKGGSPAPVTRSEEFISLLSKALKPRGYVGVNFFRSEAEIAPLFDARLSVWRRLRYQHNHMRVYRQFGQGRVGDPIPVGLTPKQQSRDYLSAMTRFKPSQIVGRKEAWGLRYSWGWLSLEIYTSEQEPTIEKAKGLRLIIWSPVTPVAAHPGWVVSPFFRAEKQIGVVKLAEDYWQSWSSHAQRHRDKWLQGKRYVLRAVTADEFEKVYHDSGKLDENLRKMFMREVRAHIAALGDGVVIKLARDEQTGVEVGGLVTADYRDARQSAHLVSFVSAAAAGTSVGYGLIDDWMERSLQRGMDWLDWGSIWQPGDPLAWRGYSHFKKQFGLYLIKEPPDLVRITIEK